MNITHEYRQEATGYTVVTFVDGQDRCQTWTEGTKREARRLARDHEALILGLDIPGCCPTTPRCGFHSTTR